MKQSIGRPFSARPSALLLALSAAAAAAVGLAACGGGNDNGSCHYTAQAINVIGQTSFKTLVSGTSSTNVNGPQGSVGLYSPDGTAAGATLLVADTSNHRILGFNGIPSSLNAAASFVIGQDATDATKEFTESNPGTSISTFPWFRRPSKVWIDSSGQYLVVADTGNNRVLIWPITLPFNSAGAIDPSQVAVLGQTDGVSGDTNQGGAISLKTLNQPTSAIIVDGKLVVADTGNSRVLVWNSIPATGQSADVVLGQTDFVSGTAGSVDIFNNATQTYSLRMNLPDDAWSDGSHLLVADTGNNRVLYWSAMPTTQDQLATSVLGVDKFGDTAPPSGSAGQTGFAFPSALASDGVDVLVADTGNNRVLRFASYLAAPSNDKAADDVFGQSTFFNVQHNDPDQNNVVGDQSVNPNTSGITAGTLYTPTGLVMLPGGQFWVGDSGNARMLRFAVASGVDGSQPQVPCGK